MKFLLDLALILPGWLLLGIYVYYEYVEYGDKFTSHFLTFDSIPTTVFHLFMLMAPVASTLLGYFAHDRIQIVANIKDLQQRYKDYYDNAPYGYHSASPGNMLIMEVNEQWLKMLGYKRDDVIGKMTITDLLSSEGKRALDLVYPAFESTGKIVDLELDFRRADGQMLPVMISSTAVKNEQGVFTRSRTIVKDNSVKKQYENVLHQVAEDWKYTFNSMPWGVMLVDENGTVLRFNEYFLRHPELDVQHIASNWCRTLLQQKQQQPLLYTELLHQADNSNPANGNGSGRDCMQEFHLAEGDRYFRLFGREVDFERPSRVFVISVVDVTDMKRGERNQLNSRNAFFNMLKDITGTYKELDEVHNGLILVLANAIDAKSPWTKGHSERVTHYSIELARKAGIKQKEMTRLRTAALLHDIGKIGTVDALLDKPEGLTVAEYEVMKEHPVKSAQILAPITRLGEIINIVKYHHEHYDGSGYPAGLQGEEIPLLSRILCIADSYDSMTADRPYRSALGKAFAIEELRRCAGSHFDPAMTEAFIALIEEGKV